MGGFGVASGAPGAGEEGAGLGISGVPGVAGEIGRGF
jgi:hypothetical protein